MMPPRLARHKGYMQARVSSLPKRRKRKQLMKFAPSQSQAVDKKKNLRRTPESYCTSLYEPAMTWFNHSNPGWRRINGLRSSSLCGRPRCLFSAAHRSSSARHLPWVVVVLAGQRGDRSFVRPRHSSHYRLVRQVAQSNPHFDRRRRWLSVSRRPHICPWFPVGCEQMVLKCQSSRAACWKLFAHCQGLSDQSRCAGDSVAPRHCLPLRPR